MAEFKFLLNIIDKFVFLHSEGHVELRQSQLGGWGWSRLSALRVCRLEVEFVKLVKSSVPLLVRQHPGGLHPGLQTLLEPEVDILLVCAKTI